MTLTLLFAVATAHAGKLADGWRGRPFGPASLLAEPPVPGRVSAPEPGVRWRCQEMVGAAPVTVAYMVDEDIFSSVMVACAGFADCQTLVDAVGAAWGKPFSIESYDSLPERFWQDGPVVGVWRYNQFSGSGVAMASDQTLYAEVKRRKAVRARSAADDL